MNIMKKQKSYIKIFDELADPSSQWEYIFSLGTSKKYTSAIQEPCYLIPGCQTHIWLKVFTNHPDVRFACDSDSVLVKGVLKIFEDLYQGCLAREIAACPPCFLDNISEYVIYSEIKQRGLKNFYEELKK